jgi:hypothetical protein
MMEEISPAGGASWAAERSQANWMRHSRASASPVPHRWERAAPTLASTPAAKSRMSISTAAGILRN